VNFGRIPVLFEAAHELAVLVDAHPEVEEDTSWRMIRRLHALDLRHVVTRRVPSGDGSAGR